MIWVHSGALDVTHCLPAPTSTQMHLLETWQSYQGGNSTVGMCIHPAHAPPCAMPIVYLQVAPTWETREPAPSPIAVQPTYLSQSTLGRSLDHTAHDHLCPSQCTPRRLPDHAPLPLAATSAPTQQTPQTMSLSPGHISRQKFKTIRHIEATQGTLLHKAMT